MSLPSSAPPGAEDGFAAPQQRAPGHAAIAEALAATSTKQLAEQIESRLRTSDAQVGIGASSVVLEVAGRPVFVKLLPLSELELRHENRQSTANLFELPGYFQYGIGSVGFGAWRELAAQQMASEWVLAGNSAHFPLLYHWRVLTGLSGHPRSDEADQYFSTGTRDLPGVDSIRHRMDSLKAAPAQLALFIEWFPSNLSDWLQAEVRQGGARAIQGVEFVERELAQAQSFMSRRGFVHFDAHFQNMLTDGSSLVLTDFGLASSELFELSSDERAFLAEHADYDRCRSSYALVHCIVKALGGPALSLRACLADTGFLARLDACSPALRPVLDRHAPVALAFGDFSAQLMRVSKLSPYPRRELSALLNDLSGRPGGA